MPELHTRLLANVIALGSPYPLVLTGGYAVRAHRLVNRPSQDLDVATQNPTPMADIAATLRAGLEGPRQPLRDSAATDPVLAVFLSFRRPRGHHERHTSVTAAEDDTADTHRRLRRGRSSATAPRTSRLAGVRPALSNVREKTGSSRTWLAMAPRWMPWRIVSASLMPGLLAPLLRPGKAAPPRRLSGLRAGGGPPPRAPDPGGGQHRGGDRAAAGRLGVADGLRPMRPVQRLSDRPGLTR